ncbi:glycosyltransferase involved in cell wall biosynthesis [Williamsia limnetica]|uniref:Glycosyltransferase involved in cell wall biosynthesis n=1 Tax=Williamsia limnetica TaxID=882452 RepID=A0A318RUW6_WILLI|nr:glycosyltransferase family 4 protein [Williamsia limnetica]PYE20199.1 glycosyltransferase involved in cell wall biosynthesis [Williamsia limnetica]
MRIAVVHSFYSEASPSGENVTVRIQVDALSRAGHDVVLISRSTDALSASKTYSVRAATTAAGIGGDSPESDLERFRPDVIHVHNLFPNWGAKWMAARSDRIVATMHNYRPVCAKAVMWRDGSDCSDCLKSGSVNALKHRCYRGSVAATLPLAWSTRGAGRHSPVLRNSKLLVTLNDRAKEVYESIVPDKDIRTIPNFANEGVGCDVSPGESFTYVGRLTEEKGFAWLAEHWPRSKQLRIVGDGPLRDRALRLASDRPDTFTYVGRVDPEEARSELASAKALILPSMWSEGIPTVALEALQAGTPILVSDRCASAVSLTHRGAGVIFDVGNGASSLEAAIRAIESDSGIRSAARALYVSSFSEKSWLSDIEEAYSDVIACVPMP